MPRPTMSSELLDAALEYAHHGRPVFPCRAHGENAKRPYTTNGFHDASTDPDQIEAWWGEHPDAMIGMPTGTAIGEFVLDIDPGKGGQDSLDHLAMIHGPLPDTKIVLTGGGGVHYYFTMPDFDLRNSASDERLGNGVDIRANGGYVIVPPSNHPSGGVYQDELSEDPIVPAPSWLLSLLREQVKAPAPPIGDVIPEGQRESTLLSLAGSMRRRGSSPKAIAAALHVENERCQPPLATSDIERMAKSVGRYAPAADDNRAIPDMTGRAEALNGTGEAQYKGSVTLIPAWREDLWQTKGGQVQPCDANLLSIFKNHGDWADLWFDEVRGKHMRCDSPVGIDDYQGAVTWFSEEMHVQTKSLKSVELAMKFQCRQNPRDLLKEFLDGLPAWDGSDRLTHFFDNVAGTGQNAYTAEVGRLLWCSLVARALDPGCQYRNVIILEGEENTGKSRLIRGIGGDEWTIELTHDVKSDDAKRLLKGAWVAELAELSSMSRSEVNALKAYVTAVTDRWVEKYESDVTERPRRTILIGSTNDYEYLRDAGSNTRFLPVRTGTIVLSELGRLRTQCLAQALVVYRERINDWWEVDADAIEALKGIRDSARAVNVYRDGLEEFLAGKDAVTWDDIAYNFLNLESKEKWANHPVKAEVFSALQQLGWEKSQVVMRLAGSAPEDLYKKPRRCWVRKEG